MTKQIESNLPYILDSRATSFHIINPSEINNIPEELRQILPSFLQKISELKETLEDYGREEYSVDLSGKFQQKYNGYLDKLESAIILLDEKNQMALKSMFRGMLFEYITQSVIISRALNKPFGYPGDYILLQALYEGEKKSPTTIGKLYDDLYFKDKLSIAVVNRVNKMAAYLESYINNAEKNNLKILNIASGSGYDLKQLSQKDLIKKAEIDCFDQELSSLLYCQNHLEGGNKNLKFRFFMDDIKKFFKRSEDRETYDLIYNIGLADYLPDRVLISLMQESINKLNKKGTFVIAHKDFTKFPYHYPSWTCNWHFIHRSPEAFKDRIISKLNNFRKIELFFESSEEVIYFISVIK